MPNTILGEHSITVPVGTTAERPASPVVGMLRYNTSLGYLEQYAASGWAAIASPPIISGVTPTAYNGESGTSFTISGSFFDSTATVRFITNAGAEFAAGSVTVTNSNSITATTPQDFTVAQEPLDVKVINGSGLSATIENVIDCGGVPAWTTASGSLGTIWNDSTGTHATLVATDPDASATISYSVSSGSLPANVTLNSSTGVISGDPTDITNDTTYNFTAAATDNAGNATTRSFSILLRTAKVIAVNSTNYTLLSRTVSNTPRSFSSQGYYTLVPSSNMDVRIQLWGGGGAGTYSGNSGTSYGGAGGYVEGDVSLTAGVTYVFLLAQGGVTTTQPTGRAFPDGGQAEQGGGYGQVGGGGSSRFGPYTQSGFNLTNSSTDYNNTNAVYTLIAGGGTGGSDYIYGYSGTAAGFGGGTTGADGGGFYPSGESLSATGKGGTQSAGGAAGGSPARLGYSQAGAKYYGGNGSGSGGGGGYFGGGGARGYYTLSGGGSGFIGAGVTNGVFYTASAGNTTHYVGPNPRSNRPGTAAQGGTPTPSRSNGSDGAILITLL